MSAAEKQEPWHELRDLPALLTPKETAALLRCTLKALYARKERGQLAGVVMTGKTSWLVRKAVLLKSLVPVGTVAANDSQLAQSSTSQGHASTPAKES